MSSLLSAVEGVNLLDQSGDGDRYPETVPGRVAHIDADFMCYETTAVTARERRYAERLEADPLADSRPLDDESVPRTFKQMKHNADIAIEKLRRLAGAEFYVCHLTPTGSSKGGRGRTAVIKEYQAQRAGEKPPHLHDMRSYIASKHNGVEHMSQEADDGLAQANYASRCQPHLSVIVSRDKDLYMVPGYYMDFTTMEVKSLSWEDSYGSIWIEQTVNPKTNKARPKKLKGRGTAYFWAQCLMGDPVDNISGLPQTVDPATGKKKQCGDVKAYDMLKDCKSDAEALAVVREAWKTWPYKWTHWCDENTEVHWYEALMGDMCSLWMRLQKGQHVAEWLRRVHLDATSEDK